LRDSIRNLLGLTVYSKLGGDLAKHTEDIKRESDKVTDAQLKQLEADEARLKQSIRENREARTTHQAELDELLEQDALLEREVRRVTGVGADSRSDLQREIGDAENQKRNANEDILKLTAELLPFAVAGRLCDELRSQVEAEEKLRQWEASKTRVHPQLDRILDKVFRDPNAPQSKPPLTVPQKYFYANRFTEEWEELFIPKPEEAADEFIHELSPKDERFILGTLEKVSGQAIGALRELLRLRERAAKRIQDANRELRNLPEDDSHIAQLFDQRKIHEDTKAKLYKIIGQLDTEHTGFDRELKSVREKIENLKKKLEKAEEDRVRVFLASRVQSVLGRYEKELKHRKIEELEDLTTEMYRRLARKDDFVGRVKINPQTFDVAVHDPRGRIRVKRSLSAGEKQIYAISLLWGLAKASDVELPIIIDTPFARLDSEHRTKIARHYFPHASEQVIILSTDEEIDHRYVELLKPYIAKGFLIEHSDTQRSSFIKEGYWLTTEP
jgi:DNA sulfur modification protein DndD